MRSTILKYSLFIALMFLFGFNAFASDVIILKNGNLIRGAILSRTETKVSIKAENGNIYEYPLIEVQNITNSDQVVEPTTKLENSKSTYTDYGELKAGFWFSAEIGEAISCNINSGNYTFTELDVTGGYRLNEFLRFGIGLGARYYNNNHYRYSSISLEMPIYATVRGNIIPNEYRNVVPYYSFDIGASIRDGFMFRSGVGIRIGQNRNAFLVNVSYLGQNIISIDNNLRKNKFTSFVMLKIGYEF